VALSCCLAVCLQARELSAELKTAAGVSGRGAGGTPFAEQPGSAAPERPLTNAQTQGVSDAYFKLLRAFVPLITDEVCAPHTSWPSSWAYFFLVSQGQESQGAWSFCALAAHPAAMRTGPLDVARSALLPAAQVQGTPPESFLSLSVSCVPGALPGSIYEDVPMHRHSGGN